jgi:hypothetical protein
LGTVVSQRHFSATALHAGRGGGKPQSLRSEWSVINQKLSPYLTSEDTARRKAMEAANSELWLVFNSRYTIEREKLLIESLKVRIQDDPWFYLKTRIYSFLRLWFTGVKTDIYQYRSAKEIVVALFLFGYVYFIFGGVIAVPFFFLSGCWISSCLRVFIY